MAFTGNYSCNTLRSGLANGTINFATDTFYLALYTNSATLDQTTTAYSTTGEATGGNYVAGGAIVTATIAAKPQQQAAPRTSTFHLQRGRGPSPLVVR